MWQILFSVNQNCVSALFGTGIQNKKTVHLSHIDILYLQFANRTELEIH